MRQGQRLDQVGHILEARLLQAQVEVKDVTDHALSGVKQLVDGELTTAKEAVKETAKAVITDLQTAAKDLLQNANKVLKERVADVGREVNSAIAVREPEVHWSGTKAVFSMAVGAAPRYQVADYRWQL